MFCEWNVLLMQSLKAHFKNTLAANLHAYLTEMIIFTVFYCGPMTMLSGYFHPTKCWLICRCTKLYAVTQISKFYRKSGEMSSLQCEMEHTSIFMLCTNLELPMYHVRTVCEMQAQKRPANQVKHQYYETGSI